MKHLKKAIEEAIDRAGIKPALNQEAAVGLWSVVVGEAVSAVTKAERVESGTMIVRVDTPVWRQELHMQKEEILKKINKKIGTKAIRKIRFI